MAKKAKKATVLARTLENIMVECAVAVGRGVGSTVEVSDAARKYWHARFRRTVKRALADRVSWKRGRKKALTVAVAMGANAAQLAQSGTIGKAEAVTAADQAKEDPRCRVGAGAGKFC
jgi:hypothetical protein